LPTTAVSAAPRWANLIGWPVRGVLGLAHLQDGVGDGSRLWIGGGKPHGSFGLQLGFAWGNIRTVGGIITVRQSVRRFMNEPAIYLFLGLLGSITGALSERLRASGRIALLLPLIPGVALWMAIGRS